MKYYFKCRRCGNNEEFVQAREDTGDLGCSLLIFGGLLPFLLLAGHQSNRVVCIRCGYLFQQPRIPWGRVALIAFLGLCLGGTACVISILLFAIHGANESLPTFAFLEPLEKAISEAPRVALYLMAFLALVGGLFGWILLKIGEGQHHRELSTRYRLYPPITRHGFRGKTPPLKEEASGTPAPGGQTRETG